MTKHLENLLAISRTLDDRPIGLLAIGVITFLSAKVYLVLLGTLLSGTPRLDDDAYVYLWKGYLLFTPQENVPRAIRNLASQAKEVAALTTGEQWWSNRILWRSQAPSPMPAANALYWAVLKASPNPRLAFFVTELIGVAAVTVGTALFLIALFGRPSAGIGMMLLSFAVFPGQGLTHFIPSTLALSGALLIWAHLLTRPDTANRIGVLASTVFLIALHPIGLVYALMTIVVHWLALRRGAGLSAWSVGHIVMWLLIVVIVASYALLTQSSRFSVPLTEIRQLPLLQGITENVNATVPMLWEFVQRNPVLLFGFIGGLSLSARRDLNPVPRWLVVIGLITLVGSLSHYLYGYPAELFSRLLVLFGIVGAGFAGWFAWYGRGFSRKVFVIVFLAWLVVSVIYWATRYSFALVRPFIIDSEILAVELSRLDPNAHILYVETDISLMASFLAGGARLTASAFPMFREHTNALDIASLRRPHLLAVPNYRALNTVTVYRLYRWGARRYGFPLTHTKSLEIRSPSGSCLEEIRLLVESEYPTLSFIVESLDKQAVHRIRIDQLLNDWVMIFSPSGKCAKGVRVNVERGRGWIYGIQEGEQEDNVLWPWKSDLIVVATLLRKGREQEVFFHFSPGALLNEYSAEVLANLVDLNNPVLTDRSGVVFLRTRESPN